MRQFRSPLIYILMIVAGVSFAVGETTDAAFIFAVLCINAAIGGYQEWRAEQNTRALQRLLQIRASVVRDGEVRDMDAEQLVPGDVVWLESGNRVVTNGIQDVALSLEPGEGGILRRKPRPPREPIFNRLMIERTAVAALVMGSVAFATFWRLLANGWSEASARNALLLLMVLYENIHIGNCRSETKSAFLLSPLRSPVLLLGTIAAQLLHIAMLYVPLGQTVLRTEPVNVGTWLSLLGLALSIFVAMEIHKWTWRRRYEKRSASTRRIVEGLVSPKE